MSGTAPQFISFRWKSAGPLYTIDGATVTHVGGSVQRYMPVIGDLEVRPGAGRLYFELYVNCDNAMLGFCDVNAKYDQDMTTMKGCFALNLQKGQVETEGNPYKKLWRMIVPVSGGTFGFLISREDGTVKVFLNGEYQGLAFDETLGLRGKTFRPCVSIAGLDSGNRDIGTGNKRISVATTPEFLGTIAGS